MFLLPLFSKQHDPLIVVLSLFIRTNGLSHIYCSKIVLLDPFIPQVSQHWRKTSSACLTMGLGTKNRQNQTAELCKEHLRSKYISQLLLVEDFILEIEGTGKSMDILKWGQFTNLDRNVEAMLSRLDAQFARWLNGDV